MNIHPFVRWVYANADWLSIFAITTIFSLITVRYYTKHDKFEGEPKLRLFWALFLGAFSVIPAIIISILVLQFVPEKYSSVIVAPIVEEGTKGMFVLWLARSDEFDGPLDGMIYGAMIGTGFAWVENLLYAFDAFSTSVGAGILLAGIRSVFQIIAHPLYTGIFGLGIGASSVGLSKFRILFRYLEAVVLHAMWNGASLIEDYTLLSYLGLIVLAIIILKYELSRAVDIDKKAYERGYYNDSEDVSYIPT